MNTRGVFMPGAGRVPLHVAVAPRRPLPAQWDRILRAAPRTPMSQSSIYGLWTLLMFSVRELSRPVLRWRARPFTRREQRALAAGPPGATAEPAPGRSDPL
jgi:hypothetical protein